MPTVIRAQVGKVVPIRFTVRKVRDDGLDGERQRTNGCRVVITKPDGTDITTPPQPVYEKRGVFVAYWNTAGLAVGDYRVKATFGVGFDTVTGAAENANRRDPIVRLVQSL